MYSAVISTNLKAENKIKIKNKNSPVLVKKPTKSPIIHLNRCENIQPI